MAGSSWEYASVSTITPPEHTIPLALHQQAADELGGNQLSGTAEEGVGEVLGGRSGYGSGLDEVAFATPITDLKTQMPQHFAAK